MTNLPKLLTSRARILHGFAAVSLIFCLFVSAAAEAQTPVTPAATPERPGPQDSYNVVYASRLFGYYRFPEVQTLTHQDCVEGGITKESAPEAYLFSQALDKADHEETALRVATGDNFAPFLLSRQMWDDGKAFNKAGALVEKEGALVEKEYYTQFNGEWMFNDEIERHHHDQWENILRGDSPIPIDNVGCFLRLMKFDAVVPGKHDFYFGPSRLQSLARYLQNGNPKSDRPGMHSTRMLGVNLYMQTRQVTSPVSQTALTAEQDPRTPPVAEGSKIRVTTPKTVLPWMRTVDIRNWVEGSKACVVEVDRLANSLRKGKLASIEPGEEGGICSNPEFRLDVKPTGDIRHPDDFIGTICEDRTLTSPCRPSKEVLKLDIDYAVAVVPPPAIGGHLVAWQRFNVAPPFFGFDRSSPGKMAADRPWVIKKQGAESIAVFGVVDPYLMQSVGRYNGTWLELHDDRARDFPVDDNYETDVQVGDPAEALRQAIEYCTAVEDCDPDTRTVLLAQMPRETADNMLSSFRGTGLVKKNIDLIITQADADPYRGTGFRTTTRTNEGKQVEFEDPVVVVPDPGAYCTDPDHPECTTVGLQQAKVTPGSFHAAGAPRVIVNESIRMTDVVPTEWFPGPVTALTEDYKTDHAVRLIDHLGRQKWENEPAMKDTALARTAVPSADDWKTGLMQIALKRMQSYCKSDAAMLQLRDVFFYMKAFAERPLNNNGYEAVLDAIFWKGDYIQCMSVAGSTINSLIQRSQDLQQRQYYGLTSDNSLTSDYSLLTAGVNADQKDSTLRLVAGKLLDPKKLYSVAVTDFLGYGDTGYPALQGAEPPPDTPWSKTKLLALSDAIGTDPTIHPTDPDTPGPVKAKDVLDSIIRVPQLPWSQIFHPAPIFTGYSKALTKALVNDGKPETDQLELAFRQRPMWSVELYKADFGYSMAAHSGLERAVPQEFPGVSAVDLTAQDSSSLTMDYLFRVQRDHGSHEIYAQSELNYGYKKTRTATKTPSTTPVNCQISYSVIAGCGDSYSRSQPANFVYEEMGYAYHFGKANNPYGWKLQLPLALQTQLSPSISLPEGLTGPMNNTTPIPSPKSYYVEGRPGFRLDFSFPKPANWTISQAGGAGGQGGGSQTGSGGGKGGKGGGGSPAGGAANGQNSSNGQNNSSGGAGGAGGGGGGGGNQTQTFDSFFEAGFELGPSLHGPNAFEFKDPTQWITSPANALNQLTGTACSAQSQGTITTVPVSGIANCFATALAPVPVGGAFTQPVFSRIDGGRTHFQDGLYFNYHLDIPVQIPAGHYTVFSNMEIVEDLRTDFFLGSRNDTPIDTHFLVDAKHALNVPIFTFFSGKLSLAPTFEMIYYTNKIGNNLYRSYSGSVALSYTFEKRTGLNTRKVFGYSNPVPTLPSLPSR